VAQADATRIPFRDGVFGSVLSNCVLEHIPDDEAAVREAARVLRPGGTFVFTVPGPRLKEGLYTFQALVARGDQKWADDYLREFDRRLAHFHYRTEAEWRGILEASGLQVETIAPYLAAPVVYIWDRIENYFTQPVFHMMSQRKLAAFILLPRRLRWWLVHRLLSRYYRREEEPTDLYGCWLIVGRKP
jgi:SAM-dependent methyltransferase